MLHPRFFEMVSYAVRKEIRVTTNSNLTLLTARRAELCLASGLHGLHISLAGASAETYERFRVRAHIDRVVSNLERLPDQRERHGSSHPQIRLIMVIMRRWGGCAIVPSGTYSGQVPTTVLNEAGSVDGHALDLLPEMLARYVPPP